MLGSIDLLTKSHQNLNKNQIELLKNSQDSGEILICIVNNVLDIKKIEN